MVQLIANPSFPPLVSQLSDKRSDILKSLHVENSQQELFDNPHCCSDTEESQEDGSLVKLQLPWRSETLATIACVLDRICIHKQASKHGRKFYTGNILQGRRKPGHVTEHASKVPIQLPSDCYSPQFLKSLSSESLAVLDVQPSVKLDSLLEYLIPFSSP